MWQLSSSQRFSFVAFVSSFIFITYRVSGTQGTTLQSQLRGQNGCLVEHAYRPQSTDDVLHIVKNALDDRESTGREFLIRAVRSVFLCIGALLGI